MTAYRMLEANSVGRDFVVGDIHGLFDSVERALAKVDFDPARDRLFSVGDLIDRGPASRGESGGFRRLTECQATRTNAGTLMFRLVRSGARDGGALRLLRFPRRFGRYARVQK